MPNLLDKILEENGIKYEDLNPQERETYSQKVFEVQSLSLGDLKDHIVNMKNSIALQLTSSMGDGEIDIRKELILKARLQNYLLLEAFLTAPEKAEKAIRDSLKNIRKDN